MESLVEDGAWFQLVLDVSHEMEKIPFFGICLCLIWKLGLFAVNWYLFHCMVVL